MTLIGSGRVKYPCPPTLSVAGGVEGTESWLLGGHVAVGSIQL